MNENDKYICEQLLGSAGVRHAPLAMLLSFDESTTWTYVPAASGKGGEWNLVNTRSLSASECPHDVGMVSLFARVLVSDVPTVDRS
jgi:hypothetical protein